jgi:hypothetical protein
MAFPTLGILDAFERLNENPLANGTWSGPAVGFTNQLKTHLTIEKAMAAAQNAASYWTASIGPDTEIYVTILTISAGIDYIGWRTALPGGGSFTGYYASFDHPNDVVKVFRQDTGSAVQLGANISLAVANGDSIGAEMIGSNIAIYHKPAAGSWTSIGTRSDATHSGAGNLWLATFESDLDDFGGGTISGGGGIIPQAMHYYQHSNG